MQGLSIYIYKFITTFLTHFYFITCILNVSMKTLLLSQILASVSENVYIGSPFKHSASVTSTDANRLYIFLFSCLFIGDLPYEAHVQTHSGGASGQPPLSPENRISQYPHTCLSHLSFASLLSLPPHLFFVPDCSSDQKKKNRHYCSPRKDTVYAMLCALFSCLVKISVAARLAAFSTPGVCC